MATLAQGAPALDPAHARWTRLLRERVSAGAVDYRALKEAPSELDAYLRELATVDRDQYDEWTEAQQMAFLINLYNASTVKLIVDHYPVASIKKIGGWLGSPFRQKAVDLWGERVTLEEVEHGWLRRRFAEPRIHFALVCGARGCPPLRSEAYVADRLEAQLNDQGRIFLGDAAKNRVDVPARTLWLSPIFKWFAEDFTAERKTLPEFVQPFLPEPARAVSADALNGFRIRYTDYDWSLNER